MVEIAIIADDLTGACDTAVQFSKRGLSTIVVSDLEELNDVACKVEVVVINTESRECNPEVAYERVSAVCNFIKRLQIRYLYKKLDSTLKGNVGSEIDALIDQYGFEAVILSPAFPEQGRETIGGYQLVYGEVSEGRAINVQAKLISHSKYEVGHVGVEKVREGIDSLDRAVKEKVKEGCKIVVVDALSRGDLNSIAKIIHRNHPSWLPCGSAGLAGEVCRAYGLIRERAVLLVSGSISKVSMRQLSYLERRLKVRVMKLDLSSILHGGEAMKNEIKRVSDEASSFIRSGEDVLVTSAFSEDDVEEAFSLGEKLGLSRDVAAYRLSEALGEITTLVLENVNREVAGVLLTGGDTASKALSRMSVKRLLVEGEVLPGIPVVRLINGRFRGLRLVTKAGAFGREDAVFRIVEYLKWS